MYRLSLKVKADIRPNDAESYSCIGNINVESAQRIVPGSLYLFLRLLCTSEDHELEEEHENDERRTKLLSIAQ